MSQQNISNQNDWVKIHFYFIFNKYFSKKSCNVSQNSKKYTSKIFLRKVQEINFESQKWKKGQNQNKNVCLYTTRLLIFQFFFQNFKPILIIICLATRRYFLKQLLLLRFCVQGTPNFSKQMYIEELQYGVYMSPW